jgi:hypothetical protein
MLKQEELDLIKTISTFKVFPSPSWPEESHGGKEEDEGGGGRRQRCPTWPAVRKKTLPQATVVACEKKESRRAFHIRRPLGALHQTSSARSVIKDVCGTGYYGRTGCWEQPAALWCRKFRLPGLVSERRTLRHNERNNQVLKLRDLIR